MNPRNTGEYSWLKTKQDTKLLTIRPIWQQTQQSFHLPLQLSLTSHQHSPSLVCRVPRDCTQSAYKHRRLPKWCVSSLSFMFSAKTSGATQVLESSLDFRSHKLAVILSRADPKGASKFNIRRQSSMSPTKLIKCCQVQITSCLLKTTGYCLAKI